MFPHTGLGDNDDRYATTRFVALPRAITCGPNLFATTGVKMENFELKAVAFEEDGKGHEEFLAGKYDTGEFSLANYLALKSRDEPLMAIPVFPNRKFRHSLYLCA